jgi:hypothetical protein
MPFNLVFKGLSKEVDKSASRLRILDELYSLLLEECHHHKHPGLGHLAGSVSRVTVALSIVSSVSQLFSFLVGCSGMILEGFGFVAFFAGVKTSSSCPLNTSCKRSGSGGISPFILDL